jgi:hypothetical protein
LSVTTTVAGWLPAAEGVKVTEIVQLAAAARLVPQLLVSAYSLGSVPPSAMLAIAKAALPELLKVNVCAVLVVPSVCVANVKEPGVSVAVGSDVVVTVQVPFCIQPLFRLELAAKRYTFFDPAKLFAKLSAYATVIVFPEVVTVVPVPLSVHWLFDIEDEDPGVNGPTVPLSALFSRYKAFVPG